jgi:hypothetical protein
LKKFMDIEHPWYRPLWVRLLIVFATGGWGLFELYQDSVVWGVLFLAVSAFAVWNLFVTYRPGPPPEDDGSGDDGTAGR